ncbi:MAG: BON domain-containing protein [Gemmataceae bacterium]|nr:BON domain-containing protein [Gemmataceae bacterium]
MKRIGMPLLFVTFLVASATSLRAQSESAERLHEMAVEMMWAADPVTFPYSLHAAFVDGRMVLAGTVAARNARDRAILNAQHATTLPIADRIEVDANARSRRPVVATEKLVEAASDALRSTLPNECLGIAVSLQGNGHVTLSGNAMSRKSQYEATVALRNVAGIRSVRNELQIGMPVVAATKQAPAVDTNIRQASFKAPTSEAGGMQPMPERLNATELEQAIRNKIGYRGEMVLQADASGRLGIQLAASNETEANNLGKQVMDLEVTRAFPVYIVVRIAP